MCLVLSPFPHTTLCYFQLHTLLSHITMTGVCTVYICPLARTSDNSNECIIFLKVHCHQLGEPVYWYVGEAFSTCVFSAAHMHYSGNPSWYTCSLSKETKKDKGMFCPFPPENRHCMSHIYH